MSYYRKYLRFLRAGLWDRPANIGESIIWKQMLLIAQRQSTVQLVCHAAMQNHGAPINEKVQSIMQSYLMTGANAHAVANKVIAKVVKKLDEAGIQALLLKGQGVASYYPVPELRQCGDIDLYVGEANYDRACEVLRDITGREGDYGRKHAAFDYGGGLSIEIHKYFEKLDIPALDKIYQSIVKEGLSSDPVPVRLGGADILTPDDTFNAFYIFHHLWRHTIGMGIGLRQLCDWGMFLHTHHGKLDLDKLNKWLLMMNLKKEWEIFGWAAVSALHVPVKSVPFAASKVRDRAKRLIRYILEKGDNRDFKFNRKSSGLKRKISTIGFVLNKFWVMLRIFPLKSLWYLVESVVRGFKKLFTYLLRKLKRSFQS